jgi:ElaB/YqjD/DUF883 family membrane-anchored ribosome-binding protein
MAQGRAASDDRLDANQEIEALRSDLEAFRKDIEARMARAATNGGRDADFRALRSDLDNLRKDFGTFVSTLKNNAGDRPEAEVEAMRERIATLGNELQAMGQQQLRKVEGKIEERPYTSLAIAFAIGFVVSRVLDRR